MPTDIPDSADQRGELVIRTIAMPGDTNANGDIFGGWVLARMDQGGGVAGVNRAQGRVVTLKVQAMTFHRPVKVGDVLSVYARIVRVGNTSFDVALEAWAKRFRTNLEEKVTDGVFTFVAISEDGRPRAVPKLKE